MSCHECGSPLAFDQRYCLECGARIGASVPARLAVPAGPPAAAIAARPWSPQLPTPRVIATLVLMLLGFGVAVGASSGPPAGAQLAKRPDLRIELPPAAAPAPAAAAAPAPETETAAPSGPSEPAATPSEPAPATPAAPAAPTETAPSTSQEESTTPAAPPAKTPPLKHVWVVALAEQPDAKTFDDPAAMPYLAKDLRERGELLGHYHPAGPSELSAGIALLDGVKTTPEQDQNCPTYADGPCVLNTESFTILDQLAANSGTWKAYAESIPAPCAHPQLGAGDPAGEKFWTAKVAPLYFHAVIDAPDCAERVVGLDALAGDLEKPPSLSLVVPDLTHDGRADLPAADAWLKQTLEPILDSKAYKEDGVVVVTTGHGGALLLSRWIKPGGTVARKLDGFALLRTLQDAFGLRRLGENGPNLGKSVWTNWSQDVHASDTGS